MLVRVLTQDAPQQAAIARDLLSRDFILLAGVVMETEWVLRSLYGWPRARIAMALAEIADLPALRGSPAGFAWVIARYAAGADFADMLHIAATPPAERFATFDRRIAAHAGPDAPVAIETLA